MSIIKDGGEPGVAAPAPLFASSWIALFLQLRHNLESLRASNEDALNQPAPLDPVKPEQDPYAQGEGPLDRTGSD